MLGYIPKKIRNAWSKHRWGMFGYLAILNIKYYSKKFFSPELFDQKSSIDQIPGVETNRAVHASSLGYTRDYGQGGSAYAAIDENAFIKALCDIPIDPSDFHFVDLGSGKGRALFLAAKAGFSKVIGVEFSADLHFLAQKNIVAASKSWPIRVVLKLFMGMHVVSILPMRQPFFISTIHLMQRLCLKL